MGLSKEYNYILAQESFLDWIVEKLVKLGSKSAKQKEKEHIQKEANHEQCVSRYKELVAKGVVFDIFDPKKYNIETKAIKPLQALLKKKFPQTYYFLYIENYVEMVPEKGARFIGIDWDRDWDYAKEHGISIDDDEAMEKVRELFARDVAAMIELIKQTFQPPKGWKIGNVTDRNTPTGELMGFILEDRYYQFITTGR